MNGTVINILETSPNYLLQQELTFDQFDTVKFIILSFDLILLSALNHAKLPQIPLFTINFQSLISEIKLKVSNQFDFHRMKYDSNIEITATEQFVDKTTIQVDKYNHEEDKIQKIQLKYVLKDHQTFKSLKNTQIRFNFGNFTKTKSHSKGFGKFSIQNFKYKLEGNNNLRKNQQTQIALFTQKNQSICNHEDESGSFPIKYMNEYGNLKSYGEKYFTDLINNLPAYKASDTTQKLNHLFICHDMKDGYYEDTKFTNPVEYLRSNSYRYNFFWHTSVFNYFSHQTISIPPRHWRELCKRYQVKCLGTFIVEEGRLDEKYFLTNQFALKLVFLAKKYKFDGYLVNIENEIKNIEALKEWLEFFTNKIHIQIPGSMISWYDSVTTSGFVEYQNQINEKNKIFYELTDSFYTNYWWTDEMLKKDLEEAQPNKTIYVGNDIWGRGTRGGGEFYTFSAIDQIEAMNHPNRPNLVPALFAPGYTYENGGQNNNPFLKANQDRLYRGVIFQNKQIGWQSLSNTQKQFLKLKNSKVWFGNFYSMNLSQYLDKGKIKITLIYRVNSSIQGKNPSSSYKILLRLQNILSNQTIIQSQVQRQNVILKPNQIKKVEIIIDANKITSKTDLQIYEATQHSNIFDERKFLISYYFQKVDWIQQVPVTKLSLNSQYNSFLNMGHGDLFYFKGKPILKNYNYLADYDIPSILSLNHPFSTEIEHQDAYIGGSSLIIHDSPIRLFFIELPITQHNYPNSYLVKIIKKGGEIESIYMIQSSGSSMFFNQIGAKNLQNGWTELIYEISVSSMKRMSKIFFKNLQTSMMMNIKEKCQIGQIYLQPQFMDKFQSQNPMIQLSISQSFRTEDKSQIFIDLGLTEVLFKTLLKQKITHRYLIVIDDQFSAFIYMDNEVVSFKGKLRQIKLRIQDRKSVIEVYDIDTDPNERTLLSRKDIDLSQLKKMPLSHKITIKNY